MEAEDYAEDFAFIRELGANALRSPAGPHAQSVRPMRPHRRTGLIDLPLIRAPFLSDVSYYPNPQLEGERSPATARNHRPAYQPAVGGHLGTLRLPLATGRKPRALCADTERAGKKMDRSRPTAATSNQDGELNQITDLIVWAAEHRLGQRPHGRPRNLARPTLYGMEPAPLGHLLRRSGTDRTTGRSGSPAPSEQHALAAGRTADPVSRRLHEIPGTRHAAVGEPGSTPCSTTARPAVRRAWRLRGSSRWTDAAARTLSIFTKPCGTARNRYSTSPGAEMTSAAATCRP